MLRLSRTTTQHIINGDFQLLLCGRCVLYVSLLVEFAVPYCRTAAFELPALWLACSVLRAE